jgi:hypothetical protein
MDTAIRRVASAWYSGNPDYYTLTNPQYSNGRQYPSIASYTLQVLERFRQAYTGGLTASDPNNYQGASSFFGTVGTTSGINLRNSQHLSDRSNINEPYNKQLEFDDWKYGESVNDAWTGQSDSRWYKIKGTNYWVPSAYIAGNAPGSSPLPPKSDSTSNVVYKGVISSPDFTQNNTIDSTWRDSDVGAVFNSIPWYKKDFLGALAAEGVFWNMFDNFLISLPNANKHLRHFLSQGNTPQSITDISFVNNLLKAVPALQGKYDIAVNRAKLLVQNFWSTAHQQNGSIATGTHWIKPEGNYSGRSEGIIRSPPNACCRASSRLIPCFLQVER